MPPAHLKQINGGIQMKKLINKIRIKICGTLNKMCDKLSNKLFKTRRKLFIARLKLNAVLTDRSGEGFVDTAIKILISVVVGALVLGGLYVLFSGTVLPTLTQRIKDMFDYAG